MGETKNLPRGRWDRLRLRQEDEWGKYTNAVVLARDAHGGLEPEEVEAFG